MSTVIGTSVISYFSSVNYDLYTAYTLQNSSVTEIIDAYQSLTNQFNFRIVILTVPTTLLRNYLLAAYQAGMVQAGFFFLAFE